MLKLLENAKIARKCLNFKKMLEFQENTRISRKYQNFKKMLEFLENVSISRKYHNFQKLPQFLENAKISRKYQKMLKFVENARISRKCQISGPHNAKKALYVIISAEIPENQVHKSYCLTVIFDEAVNFFSSPCQVVPGACLSQIVTNSHTCNTHKHP